MAEMTRRKALCVGINTFQNYPQYALNGCTNDAQDMAALFKDLLAFGAADITTLTDANATKANIMAQLQVLVSDAKAGKLDVLAFSFSSHGTQMTDTSGDETDGKDEAFVPHDIAQTGGDWDPKHIISDDEFHDLFTQVPTTCLLEVFLDTCHSGTGLKGLKNPGIRPRYIPPPSEPALGKSKKVRGFTLKPRSMNDGVPDAEGDTTATRNIILWSGCRSNQTSADAFFNGRYNGAFTYNYVKVMRDSGGALSRAQTLTRMKQLMANEFEQIPQLEADATNRKNQLEQ